MLDNLTSCSTRVCTLAQRRLPPLYMLPSLSSDRCLVMFCTANGSGHYLWQPSCQVFICTFQILCLSCSLVPWLLSTDASPTVTYSVTLPPSGFFFHAPPLPWKPRYSKIVLTLEEPKTRKKLSEMCKPPVNKSKYSGGKKGERRRVHASYWGNNK